MSQKQNEITICPILMYTSIVSYDDGKTSFCTTAKKFETDMETLIANGYNPISLREAHECRNGIKAWKEKPICVIFVGGYENNYTIAYPILRKLSIPASIFVATDLVGVRICSAVENFSPHFNWKQADEMQQSGLVEIFPMWHPFDFGRPIDDILNKISLIRNKLHDVDPSLAIAYNNCTDDELSTLIEAKIRICITDCFHITEGRLKKGMLPAISVDFTSNVMDVINQYIELCQDTLEKDFANTNEAPYVEPAIIMLSKSISLPIDKKPLVRNYLRHAFPLSIMQAENKECAERLILNEYIDVIFKPTYNWYDYHNYMYDSWDCLECKKMTYDLLNENSINVVEYIIHALSLGYYCDVWLDTYYIPDIPGYKQSHMTHGILIFSFSAATREFGALSYDLNGYYDELHIPIKALYMGCSNSYFDYINLIKNRKSTIIEYDIRELYAKLNNYLNSVCHDDNKRYSKKCAQQYYNYEASQKFIENLKKVADKDKYVHLTSLFSFAEHKRIMMWRIQYIANKEKLPFNFGETYASTIKFTEMLINLGIKYNMTNRGDILKYMENIMNNLCDIEKNALELLLYNDQKI